MQIRDNLKKWFRIGAVEHVFIKLGQATNSRIIPFFQLHVDDDLKMKMRWPIPVLMGLSEMCEFLSLHDI
jgi:hypothetical protein